MQFSTLKLQQDLQKNLHDIGWRDMTPIQKQALPPILDGRDVIGIAKTGSGKTGAYALGILDRVDAKSFHVQALVLCPTRELADQVTREFRRLARYLANTKILSLYGGTALGPQVGSLAHGAHIVVGTPGRVAKHISKGTLRLRRVGCVVLDEADRMLDMGFEDEVTGILAKTQKDRQTLLFSATFQPSVRALCAAVTRDPIELDATTAEAPNQISQLTYLTRDEDRLGDLARALTLHDPAQALVFCNTKVKCDEVTQHLQTLGWAAATLHGDLEQKDREMVMIGFKQASIRILIATDVAARGLDIEQLPAVVNYDLPEQSEVYIHRIGRTGRAGEVGLAISLYTQNEEHRLPSAAAITQKTLPTKAKLSQPQPPQMVSFRINGGRKDKLRPGDIVGALTVVARGINAAEIGKIHVRDYDTFVAVNRGLQQQVTGLLADSKIKGRYFKSRCMTHWGESHWAEP